MSGVEDLWVFKTNDPTEIRADFNRTYTYDPDWMFYVYLHHVHPTFAKIYVEEPITKELYWFLFDTVTNVDHESFRITAASGSQDSLDPRNLETFRMLIKKRYGMLRRDFPANHSFG